MGHTHYNELANDGHIIYAATRSTGQVEEGPPGFSATTIDNGVVSWKFKPIREWPFAMITSPSDRRLMVNSSSAVLRGVVAVRARVWAETMTGVMLSADNAQQQPMHPVEPGIWTAGWDSTTVADGPHSLTVKTRTNNSHTAVDTITVCVDRQGQYHEPRRSPIDYENATGPWPEKHILGTQLGPNENGRHWPSKRERQKAAQ